MQVLEGSIQDWGRWMRALQDDQECFESCVDFTIQLLSREHNKKQNSLCG